nr:DpnD/PcfM family protein [Clostridia bacterium]
MNKYKVEITETLQKTIEVEADNKEDAMHKVMKMYKNSEVILDDNDFVNLDFNNV